MRGTTLFSLHWWETQASSWFSHVPLELENDTTVSENVILWCKLDIVWPLGCVCWVCWPQPVYVYAVNEELKTHRFMKPDRSDTEGSSREGRWHCASSQWGSLLLKSHTLSGLLLIKGKPGIWVLMLFKPHCIHTKYILWIAFTLNWTDPPGTILSSVTSTCWWATNFLECTAAPL